MDTASETVLLGSSKRTHRFTGAGMGVNVRGDHAYWVMWIGARQWQDLPGEFDVGQPGWVCAGGDAGGAFRFFPAFGAHSAWAYQVVCRAEDVMRFTPFENA